MKLTIIPIVTLCWLTVGCSEKNPVYPNAGLRVYSDGSEVATYGLIMDSPDGPPGIKIKLTPKSMRFANGDHEVSIQWEPVFTGSQDQYNLVITADRAMSKQRVIFSGQPIILIEEPFRVVMENVYFKKANTEQSAAPNP